MFRGICVAVLSLTSSVSCWANELLFRKDSITVFGGVYTTVNMGETFNPFANHDSTYLVAGAYRREFIKLPWNIVLGGEIGLEVMGGSDGPARWHSARKRRIDVDRPRRRLQRDHKPHRPRETTRV